MATIRYINGSTPNGGVRSECRFQDDNGNPVDELLATRAEIVEFDRDGKEIFRTYGAINR